LVLTFDGVDGLLLCWSVLAEGLPVFAPLHASGRAGFQALLFIIVLDRAHAIKHAQAAAPSHDQLC
jgi:hypothetical protein